MSYCSYIQNRVFEDKSIGAATTARNNGVPTLTESSKQGSGLVVVFVSVGVHLHLASASTVRQLRDDASDSVLIENNSVTWKWDATQSGATPLFTTHVAKWAKVMFHKHLSVQQCGGSLCLGREVGRGLAREEGRPPPPPGRLTPPPPPPKGREPENMVNARVCIQLECTLVFNENRIAALKLRKIQNE